MRQRRPQTPSYLHAFDVYRVLAFFGVFGYHLAEPYVPAGYLGVVGFFVLAGYLSMRKVIRHPAGQPGRETVWENLSGRFSKLYPQLLTFLFVVALLMILFFPQFLDNFKGQVQSAALSLNNFWQILSGESYFEGAGYLKPMTHIWALSLEVQFYLLFGLLIYPFYKNRHRNYWLGGLIAVTVASAALYLFLFPANGDPSRVYYGLDTRLFSFTFGMGAAILFERPRHRAPVDKKDPVWIAKQVGIALFTLASVGVYFATLQGDLMLRYGIVVYTIFLTVLMALTRDNDNVIAKVGQTKVIKYLAARSYLLYLWHYPVFLMSERFLAFIRMPSWAIVLLKVVLAFAVSEIFWWLGKLFKKAFDDSYRGLVYELKPKLDKAFAFLLKPSFWLSCLLVLILVFAPWTILYEATGGAEMRRMEQDLENREAEIQAEREKLEQKMREQAEKAPTATIQVTTDPTEEKITIQTGPGGWEIKGRMQLPLAKLPKPGEDWQYDQVLQNIEAYNEQFGKDFQVDLKAYKKYRDIPFAMIGDSVSVITSYYIDPYLPHVYLNALSNRQTDHLWDVYKEIKDYDLIGEALVVALGTNGAIRVDMLEKVWEDLNQEKPMLLFTIVLPYALEEQGRNKDLRDFANSHEMVWLVEWNKNAKEYPEFFQEDSIHPAEAGCMAHCQLLLAKLLEIVDLYEKSGLLDIVEYVEEPKELPPDPTPIPTGPPAVEETVEEVIEETTEETTTEVPPTEETPLEPQPEVTGEGVTP